MLFEKYKSKKKELDQKTVLIKNISDRKEDDFF